MLARNVRLAALLWSAALLVSACSKGTEPPVATNTGPSGAPERISTMVTFVEVQTRRVLPATPPGQ